MKKLEFKVQILGAILTLVLDLLLLYRGYWVVGLHFVLFLAVLSLVLETRRKRFLNEGVKRYSAFFIRVVTFIIWIVLFMAAIQFGGVF